MNINQALVWLTGTGSIVLVSYFAERNRWFQAKDAEAKRLEEAKKISELKEKQAKQKALADKNKKEAEKIKTAILKGNSKLSKLDVARIKRNTL